MRSLFRDKVESVLMDKNNPVNDWFLREMIEKYWTEHLGAHRDHGKKLWALYCLMCFVNNTSVR